LTAGTRVDADVAAGFDGVGAGAVAGAGSVVATVAGAEHAANVNDAKSRTDVADAIGRGNNDFMTELTEKGIAKN
jgi:hypothetical protein